MSRYLIAVLVTTAAVGLGLLLGQLAPATPHPLVVPTIAAVLAAAWLGGVRAGLVSAALGSLALVVCTEPRSGLRVEQADDQAALLSLVVTGLVGCWVRATALADRPLPAPPGSKPTLPNFWWLGGFVVANVVAAGLGQGLRLIPGVAITFWPPAGIFVAALLLTDRAKWPWWVAAAGVAELTGNALWFHNPLHLAALYFAANTATAMTAALLVKRAVGGASRFVSLSRLEAPRNAALFAVLAGIVAPVVGATVIATADAITGKHPFGTAWPLVWLGDGTGLLLSAPLTLAAAHVWRHRGRIRVERSVEFAATCGLTLLLAWLALRGLLPTVYLTLPAVVWMAVRFQLRGAWVVLTAVVLTVAVFTRSGLGEFAGTPDQMREQVVALQAFLGVCALTALVVAGLSTQYVRALAKLRAANQSLEQRVLARTAALRESEGRFRLAADAVNGIIYEYDFATGHVERSRGVTEVLGYRPDEVPPTAEWWQQQVHPDDWPVGQWRAERIAAGEVPDVVYRVRHKDGRWLHVEDRAVLVRDGDGRPVKMVGCTTDVTARITSAAERDRLAALLDSYMASAPVGLAVVDREFRYIRLNDSLAAMNGLPVAAHVGKTVAEVVPAIWPAMEPIFRRVIDTAEPVAGLEVTGESAWQPTGVRTCIATFFPVRVPGEGVVGVGIAVLDITDRKRAEERVHDRERFVQRILAASPGVVYLFDLAERRTAFINDRVTTTLGVTPEQVVAAGERFMADHVHPDDLPALQRHTERVAALADGELLSTEYRMRHADGRWVWFASRDVVFARTPDGRPSQVLGVAADITELKQAEQQVRASEERLRVYFEHAPASVAVFDREMRYLYANRRWRADFGLDDRELTGRSHYDVFPDIPDRWREVHRRGLAGEVASADEDRFDRLDGSVQWLRWEVRPWHAATGEVGGIILYTEDLTARKRAEEGLRESERRLRLTMAAAATGVWDWDVTTNAVTWTPECYPIHGMAEGEFDGTAAAFDLLVHPDDRERVWAAVRAATEGRTRYECEFRIVRPDGGVRWVANTGRAVYDSDRPVRMVGTITDITDRREAAERLRQSEQFNRSLMDGTADCVKVLDTGGRLLHMNAPGLCVMEIDDFGPLCGQEWEGLWPADTREEVRRAVAAALGGGGYSFRSFCPTAKGTPKWWEVTVSPVREADGGPVVRLLSVSRDITARREAERRLEEGERRFRGIFNSAFQYVGLLTPDGTLIEANRTALEQGGLTAGDVIGRPFWECYWWTIDERTSRELKAAVGRAAAGELVRYDVDVRMAGGRVVTIDFSLKPVRDDAGRVVLLVPEGRDVTDLKRAERGLRAVTAELRRTLDTAATGLVRVNRDLRYLSANPAYAQIVGVPVEGIVGRPVAEVMGGPAFETIRPHVERVLRGERVEYEAELPFAAGGSRHLHAVYTPDEDGYGNVVGWVASVTDITSRKEAELRVRQSEAFARQVSDVAPSILYVYDLDEKRNVWANRETFAGLGYTREQLDAMSGDLLGSLLHPDDLAPYRSHAARLTGLADGEAAEFEYRMRAADGSWRWLASRDMAFRRADGGRVTQIIGAALDITARREAEGRVRASERRFRAVFDHQFQFTGLLTADGRVVEISESAIRNGGFRRDELVGLPFVEMPWFRGLPDAQAAWRRQMAEALSGGGTRSQVEAPFHTSGGAGRWVKFPTNSRQRESGVNSRHEEDHRWQVSGRRTRPSTSSRRCR